MRRCQKKEEEEDEEEKGTEETAEALTRDELKDQLRKRRLKTASHFVRHCARLDSSPSSRHYGSLYINGVAWPNLFQGVPDAEQPSGEAPEANRRCPSRHLQPSAAHSVLLEGAEREEKGKEQVRAYSPTSSIPICGHCFCVHLL